MISTTNVTWREYLSEFLMAYLVSLAVVLALFRAPSFFVHLIGAVLFGGLFFILRRNLIAFGNPVMTAALVGLRNITPKVALAFLSLQILGGTLAGLTAMGMTADFATRIAGVLGYAKISFQAGLGEFLGAFLLVAGIMALVNGARSSEDSANMTNIVFLSYISLILAALLGSLALVNPAAAFALSLHENVIYTLVPLLGGFLGGAFYTFVVNNKSVSQVYGKKQ